MFFQVLVAKYRTSQFKFFQTGKGGTQNVLRICWLIKRSLEIYNRQQYAQVFLTLWTNFPPFPPKIAFPNYTDQHNTTCNCTTLKNMYRCTKFLVSVTFIIFNQLIFSNYMQVILFLTSKFFLTTVILLLTGSYFSNRVDIFKPLKEVHLWQREGCVWDQ